MHKMERHQVIDYGFTKRPDDDARLTLEGKDFNDYHFGSGWNRKEALQFAIELIEEQGVQASKALIKEMEDSSTVEQVGVDAQQYSVAVRFYYDRSKEDAERDANIERLCEERRQRHEALLEEGGFPEDELAQA